MAKLTADQRAAIRKDALDNRQFFRKLETMPRAINKDLRVVVTKTVLLVETQAKLNVTKTGDEHPQVDTGLLRGSIAHLVGIERGLIVGKVGTRVKYGPFLEFGTVRMPAYPWLFPAAEKYRAGYIRDVKVQVNKTVIKHWR